MTDRITHAARSRWERGQTRISGRYVHLRWDELKPDVRDALVEEMRLTAADLDALAVEAVPADAIPGGHYGMHRWKRGEG